jgi:hypothetical protein
MNGATSDVAAGVVTSKMFTWLNIQVPLLIQGISVHSK